MHYSSMVRFVRLNLYDAASDDHVWRWFNVDMIRHIEPGTNRVMLNGARVPIIVSEDSMSELMRVIGEDVACSKFLMGLEHRLDALDLTSIAENSKKVAVLHQALVNFSQMLRGKEGVAILEQLGDETDELLDVVYRDISDVMSRVKKPVAPASVSRPSLWSRIVGFFRFSKQ